MQVIDSPTRTLRDRLLLLLSLLVALPVGCYSENEIRNCVTPIEVGVTQPDDGQEYLQGYPLSIEANIRSLCGSSFLEEALYVVSSDVDDELGGQFLIEDGLLSFHSEQLLALGPHTMTLRADSENAASGEGTVEIVVLENLPPTVEITSPTPEENEFEATIGVTIHAQVTDPAEPLDSLTLAWTLDGITLEEGPAHADAEGNVAWTLVNQAPGCREIRVTVIDTLDQQSSDEAEFVLWTDETDLTPFQWWLDEDDDGYGTANGSLTSCSAPAGEWLNPTAPDCDDANSDIYPGRPDYCGDGIDSDCNDLTPAGCSPTADANNIASGHLVDSNFRLELIGPASDSRLGVSLAGADVDGDGLGDLIIGSLPEDAASGGVVYVIFGRDIPAAQASVTVTSIAGMTFTGAHAGAKAGTSVAAVGDLDGDGDEEFLVSAPGERSGDGIVYLVPGFYEVNGNYSLEDTFSEVTTPNARGAIRFVGANSDALRATNSAGDINGDGHTDILIGAPGNSTGGTSAGAAYLVYGGPSHFDNWWDASTGEPQAEILLDAAVTAGTSAARFVSSTTNENLGHSVDRLGDINGDGFDDLIIGASPAGGTVRLFFGGGS